MALLGAGTFSPWEYIVEEGTVKPLQATTAFTIDSVAGPLFITTVRNLNTTLGFTVDISPATAWKVQALETPVFGFTVDTAAQIYKITALKELETINPQGLVFTIEFDAASEIDVPVEGPPGGMYDDETNTWIFEPNALWEPEV